MTTALATTLPTYARDERAAGRSTETVRMRLSYLRRWADLDDPTLRGFIAMLAAHPDWSPQSRASFSSAVRSWLRWCHRNGALPGRAVADPSDIPTFRVPRHPGSRGTPDTRILAALADCDDATALMILLAREAGLRRAEIAQVHTRDLLPDGRLLVHGKGNRDRAVPVSAMLAARLTRLPPGYAFPSDLNPTGHVCPDTVANRVTAAVGGSRACHSLRHAFAEATYAASGHDLRCVQELLGHASVATTQVYLSVSDEALRSSVDRGSLAVAPVAA